MVASANQLRLFPKRAPFVVAYGMGVDSTAMLIGLYRRGQRPDLILFADTGGEKDETYAYRPIMNEWLRSVGFPEIQVVRYVPKDFKNWPPYHTLEQNCLTNGTLPSLAFGFKSCSMKWKAAPQHEFMKHWQPALDAWAAGLKVVKAIGYDNGPKDIRRRNHIGDLDDPQYEFRYPLIEWEWDRERCMAEIEREGLPIPLKSSCFFCPAMKPDEVRALPADKLVRIVVMEARAKPRLVSIQGLWRKPVKGTRGGEKKPGMMTELIRDEGLLPAHEIDQIVADVPKDIVLNQELYARGEKIPGWPEFFGNLCGEAA